MVVGVDGATTREMNVWSDRLSTTRPASCTRDSLVRPKIKKREPRQKRDSTIVHYVQRQTPHPHPNPQRRAPHSPTKMCSKDTPNINTLHKHRNPKTTTRPWPNFGRRRKSFLWWWWWWWFQNRDPAETHTLHNTHCREQQLGRFHRHSKSSKRHSSNLPRGLCGNITFAARSSFEEGGTRRGVTTRRAIGPRSGMSPASADIGAVHDEDLLPFEELRPDEPPTRSVPSSKCHRRPLRPRGGCNKVR